jgi:hypothetical protein
MLELIREKQAKNLAPLSLVSLKPPLSKINQKMGRAQ